MDAAQGQQLLEQDDMLIEERLSTVLGEDETLIARPVVRGETLDYAIVTPQAIFVMHVRDWHGQIRPTSRGAWRQRLDSGEVFTHANPKASIRRQEQALRRFLDAAFPSLHIPTYHVILLTDPSAQVFLHGSADPPVVELANLRSEMDSLTLGQRGPDMDDSLRTALVEALGSRTYQTFELANQPFIFRSGGFFGFGKRARTIKQVVRHLEQHPKDGIYHLWNGSLSRWLRDQGATHLADVASRVIKRPESERIALETFLQESGLVDRPSIKLKPKSLNFGYVGVGERVTMVWRVRRGRGRGYLHGTALSRSPWLHVDPNSFEGQLDAHVTVVTEAIPITERPARGKIQLQTNATEQPIEVQTYVNVRSMPSPFEVRIVRPLLGAILSGGLGVLLGIGLHTLGVDAGLLTKAPDIAWLPPERMLPALVGAIWAIVGFIRGWNQSWAWPTWYATVRWLGRTLAWMAGLGLATMGLYALARWLVPSLDSLIPTDASLPAALLGASLGTIPSSIGEIRASKFRGIQRDEAHPVRKQLVPFAWAAGIIAAVVLVVAGVRFFAPEDALSTATETGSDALVTWMDARQQDLLGLRDKVLIRYYDRRATPIPTPSITPVRTPTATPGPTGTVSPTASP